MDALLGSSNIGRDTFRPAEKIAAIDLVWRNKPAANAFPTKVSRVDQSLGAENRDIKAPSKMPLTREPALIPESLEENITFSNYLANHGELILQVFLDRFGTASSVRTLKSTMPREIEGQIVKNFYLAKYVPGERNSIPVSSSIIISVQVPLPASSIDH